MASILSNSEGWGPTEVAYIKNRVYVQTNRGMCSPLSRRGHYPELS